MCYNEYAMKQQKSLRLSDETLTLAERIARKLGITRNAAFEYSIRRTAQVEGIDALPEPPPAPKPRKPRRQTAR
jgi:hypothetical protein